jgi:hypothetical protein
VDEVSFRRVSRDRLRAELAAAIQRLDVQAVHTILVDNGGDVVDVDAVLGAGPAAEQLRQALIADYRAWADEMADDDVAVDVPGVLMALAQPDLWSGVSA